MSKVGMPLREEPEAKMRRAITEWGLVFSAVLTIAVVLIWLDSVWPAYFHEPLYLGNDLFARFTNGRFCLFSDLGPDWKPVIEGVDPRAMSWVRTYTNWFFPGIEYNNRLFANGRTIWSLEVAPVILLCVLLTIMAILWRVRWGRWIGPRRPAPENND